MHSGPVRKHWLPSRIAEVGPRRGGYLMLTKNWVAGVATSHGLTCMVAWTVTSGGRTGNPATLIRAFPGESERPKG